LPNLVLQHFQATFFGIFVQPWNATGGCLWVHRGKIRLFGERVFCVKTIEYNFCEICIEKVKIQHTYVKNLCRVKFWLLGSINNQNFNVNLTPSVSTLHHFLLNNNVNWFHYCNRFELFSFG
jgi:hypothetical protein